MLGFSLFLVLVVFFVWIPYLLFLQELVENVEEISYGDLLSAFLIWFSGGLFFPTCNCSITILLIPLPCFWVLGIQGTVKEEVIVLMAFPVVERNMLIVHCLILVFIMIF